MYIYIAKLDDCLVNVSKRVFNIISYNTRIYIKGKYLEKDRYSTMISEILVRMIYRDRLNLSEVTFDRNNFGLFCSNNENYNISISHSGNYIVAVVSEYEVGIDIQYMDCNMLDIAKRFFFVEEVSYIYKCQKGIKNRFYEVWTKKESCYKYNKFKLNCNFLEINTINDKRFLNKCSTLVFDRDYMISICSDKIIKNIKEDILFISSHEINDYINNI
ncbi:putative 4'-phosphopantetheinyl transferase sfp [Clostridioides difficile T6]|nr:putative 4'-phosphopantetheinyl transferase sfp [Clostridioides difficile T6]